jgi:hypothetical protein
MPLDPRSEAAGLTTTLYERSQDVGRQLRGLSGGKRLGNMLVNLYRRSLTKHDDVGRVLEADAVGR